MRIKKTALTLALAAFAAHATAQELNFEGTDVNERIGYSNNNNEDSIKVGRQHISLFQQGWETKNYADAIISLRWLLENAPYASNDIYAQGPFVYYSLVLAEQDANKKVEYFNEMMNLFDARLKNLDALNTWTRYKSTKGDVLSVKAEYYNWTAPQCMPGSGYTLNKSYSYFSEAIKEVRENGGREITGSFLQTFFLVSDAMYKNTTNNGFREQYLQDYLDSKDACEKMLELAKEAQANGDEETAQKLLATYDAPLAAIEATFSQSGAADHDQLIAIYTKKFEDYKNDINKLNTAVNLMAQNDCDDSEIYYQYAEAAYAIQPTFTSAIGLAQKAQQNGEQAKALEYYNKAIDLSTSDANRGIICWNISNSLYKGKQYTGALTYAQKAAEYNPNIAGKSYMTMAKVYTSLGQYNDAIQWCTKASSADIAVSGQADRLKQSIQKTQEARAKNAAAKAAAEKEYQDYLRKKKAEEDFWNN